MDVDSSQSDPIIYAAGGLLWRQDGERRLLAVVHRPRYNDWSLPKGKLQAGEDMESAARREVEEETGCVPELVRPAGLLRYRVKEGLKEVRFWHMRLVREGPFRPSSEVNFMDWLTKEQALRRLSYPAERALVRSSSVGS
jgi:8-oxo-dGTP pyrophosphatase MutT (NUDIX family)